MQGSYADWISKELVKYFQVLDKYEKEQKNEKGNVHIFKPQSLPLIESDSDSLFKCYIHLFACPSSICLSINHLLTVFAGSIFTD